MSCFQVTEEEKELQWKMPQIWEDLVLKSKNIDASLFAVKKKFKEVCILAVSYMQPYEQIQKYIKSYSQ